ncbi:MAG: DUF2834 domain-containing protein [Cyanobacteriota bacterium]|nr:DUF2834 domain-containing protein [Cyanobacteriota bacterium]
MLSRFYCLLCIVGTILPYSQFVPFLLQHGLSLQLFIEQVFANRVSSFAAADLIATSFVLWTFVYVEGTRLKMQHLWVYVAANLTVGVSLGLPLFLWVRQRHLEQQSNTAS